MGYFGGNAIQCPREIMASNSYAVKLCFMVLEFHSNAIWCSNVASTIKNNSNRDTINKVEELKLERVFAGILTFCADIDTM